MQTKGGRRPGTSLLCIPTSALASKPRWAVESAEDFVRAGMGGVTEARQRCGQCQKRIAAVAGCTGRLADLQGKDAGRAAAPGHSP